MSTFNAVIQLSSQPAIIIPDGPTLTYSQLLSNAVRLQQLFTHPSLPLKNAPPQSAIGLSIPNLAEFVVGFLLVVMAGRIAAPLNFSYKKAEFDFYLQDLDAKAIFVPKNTPKDSPIVISAKDNNAYIVEIYYTDAIQFTVFQDDVSVFSSSSVCGSLRALSAKPSDIALILHTSGTTGRPKAVPLTHKNITRLMAIIAQTYALSPEDVTYVVMPLFHVHGLIGALFSTLYSHGSAVIAPRFSAHKFWNDFTKYHATWYSAVPTIHQILLKNPPKEIPPIRFIRSCSSALAPANLKKLEETFKAPVVEAMGMTECAHCVTSNNLPQFGLRKAGTVGQPHGVEIVILDSGNTKLEQGKVGEVSIKGENVTPGYLNNPKANKENFTDGYFRTGDQGYFDEDGFLVLTGRIKELINRGGEKISPIELDNVMLTHPKVAEAVAFGAPDEKYGQVVHAAVVLVPGAKLSLEEFQAYLEKRIAKFKVPERVFFTDKLPKTATGKIQRRKMVDHFSRRLKL